MQGAASGPGCHFSIPTAFSGALSNLTDVVQLIFLVDSNPFPFGYIGNYTVSTKVVSMAFQTQAGAQIPIGQLASERAITVKVPSSSDQVAQGLRVSSSSVVIPPRPRSVWWSPLRTVVPRRGCTCCSPTGCCTVVAHPRPAGQVAGGQAGEQGFPADTLTHGLWWSVFWLLGGWGAGGR